MSQKQIKAMKHNLYALKIKIAKVNKYVYFNYAFPYSNSPKSSCPDSYNAIMIVAWKVKYADLESAFQNLNALKIKIVKLDKCVYSKNA